MFTTTSYYSLLYYYVSSFFSCLSIHCDALVWGEKYPAITCSLCLIIFSSLQSPLDPFECQELMSVINPGHNLGGWDSCCCICDQRTLVSLLSALAPQWWDWPSIHVSPSTARPRKPFMRDTSPKGSCSQPRS